jgi:Family of unknown function (DUF6159)
MAVATRIGDGASMMRASFELVRGNRALLWFPLASTCCFLLTAGFWLFEGAWLYSAHGPWLLFVPLVVLGLYSVTFAGIFFSVALAGATDAALEGNEPSFGDSLNIAWSRLGGIASWAAYALTVSIALGLVQRVNRWLGAAAEVAWNFATFFVVPLITFEGLGGGAARRRSFELARINWRAESGGLGALQAALLAPGLVLVAAFKALESGDVHSHGMQALLGIAVVLGLALGMVAQVVRQVFAVALYRASVA